MPASLEALRLDSADLDADGKDDILLSGAYELSAAFFSGVGGQAESQRLPTSRVDTWAHDLAIADVNADGRRDVVVVTEDAGLDVLQSTAPQAFVPVSHATPSPWSAARVIAMSTGGPDRTLFAWAEKALYQLPSAATSSQPEAVVQLPLDVRQLANQIAVANFDTRSPCDELAVAQADGSSVSILGLCTEDGWMLEDAETVSTLTLAANSRVSRGVMALEIQGDDKPDILVMTEALPVSESPEGAGHVAFGVGDGSFHSLGQPLPVKGGNNQFREDFFPRQTLRWSFPRAAGNLNADKISDFVWWDGTLYLSGTDERCQSPHLPGWFCVSFIGRDWDFASVLDMNGNGINDVVAGKFAQRRLEFLNGLGNQRFSYATIDTRGFPASRIQPVIGDLDGDLMQDLAFLETERIPSESDPNGSGQFISALFGKALAIPTDVVRQASAVRVDSIAAGQFASQTEGSTDLAALWSSSFGVELARMEGRTDRFLHTPLYLPQGEGRRHVVFVVSGRFGSKRPDDLAIFSEFVDGVEKESEIQTQLHVLRSSGPDGTRAVRATPPGSVLPWQVSSFDGRFLVTDLNGDDTDEIIITKPPDPDAPDHEWNELYTARLANDQWTLNETPLKLPVAISGRTIAKAGDADGDGLQDLLYFARPEEGGMPAPLVLLRNNGTGQLAVSDVHILPLTVRASAAAFLNADADPEKELALLVQVPQEPNSSDERTEVRIAQLEQKPTWHLVVGEPLETNTRGFDISSGDYDADGIDGVVVTGFGTTTIYRGVPRP